MKAVEIGGLKFSLPTRAIRGLFIKTRRNVILGNICPSELVVQTRRVELVVVASSESSQIEHKYSTTFGRFQTKVG